MFCCSFVLLQSVCCCVLMQLANNILISCLSTSRFHVSSIVCTLHIANSSSGLLLVPRLLLCDRIVEEAPVVQCRALVKVLPSLWCSGVMLQYLGIATSNVDIPGNEHTFGHVHEKYGLPCSGQICGKSLANLPNLPMFYVVVPSAFVWLFPCSAWYWLRYWG